MMRPLLISALCAFGGQAFAEGALSEVEATDLAMAETRQFCTEQGGTLELAEGAASAVDLAGDGSADDWIISEIGAFCGPDFGYLGGSAGGIIHTVVGRQAQGFWAGAWALQDIGFTVDGEALPTIRTLILAQHGSACDSFGAAPCMLAVTWDGTKMISASPNK
jgi:hypothetical protein